VVSDTRYVIFTLDTYNNNNNNNIVYTGSDELMIYICVSVKEKWRSENLKSIYLHIRTLDEVRVKSFKV